MKKRQFRTTILIDNDKAPFDDLDFISSRRLKPTNLLRIKIKELRAREDGEPDAEILIKNIKGLQEQIKELFNFIDEKGLFNEFLQKKKKEKI